MTISEPMTAATDFILGAATVAMAWRLAGRSQSQRSRAWWVMAFLALAGSAFVGGTYHGLRETLGAPALEALWKLTVLAAGLASWALLNAAASATLRGAPAALVNAAALSKMVVYLWWMAGHDEFIYVLADTAVSLLAVSALHGRLVWSRRDRASVLILAGVGVSAAGAAVQASGFRLHDGFNHNDLFHVIQILAMVLYYRGALVVVDAGEGRARPLEPIAGDAR